MKQSRRARALLDRWRSHCENVHGATEIDYRQDVVGWHKRSHPTCPFRGTAGGGDSQK